MPEDMIPELTPDLRQIESALKLLNPAQPAFSRERLLYEAGKAAARPRMPQWLMPALVGLFATSTLIFGVIAFDPPEPKIQYIRDYIPVPQAPPSLNEPDVSPPRESTPVVDDDARESNDLRKMLAVRREVIRHGADALPAPAVSGTTPKPNDRELERWLQIPPGTFLSPRNRPSTTNRVNPKE